MQVVFSALALVLCLVIGVPVPLAFIAATIFLVFTGGYDPIFLLPYGYSSIGNLVLLCIPLFIICGGIIRRGHIGTALINFVEQFTKRFKSGLGVVTVVTCAVFGAISGSAAATATAVGGILAPRLIEKGYPKGVAASLISSSCVLALLIPPSAAQIIYAWSTGQSVLACFLATVIPGIILTVLLCISQHFQVRKCAQITVPNKEESRITLRSFAKDTGYAIPALFMPVIILGGIYGGLMTPMESAAVATLYCVPIAVWFYKGIRSPRELGETLVEAGESTGAIMMMMMCAILYSRLLTTERVPDALVDFFIGVSSNRYVVLIMLNVVMIIMGMIMDDGSAIMLAGPLLAPVASAVGVSPIHFAAILGVNLGMGTITPPCAPNIYLASKIAGVPVPEMLKPTFIFILTAWLPTLLLVTFVPDVALLLPRIIMGLNI